MNKRPLHQLNIHSDVEWGQNLIISYSYPYEKPVLRENQFLINWEHIPDNIIRAFIKIKDALVNNIPEEVTQKTIRLPHTINIKPEVSLGILTIVTQDQGRKEQLPIARLYYYVTYPEMEDEKTQYESRIDGLDVKDELNKEFYLVSGFCNKMAWQNYESRFGPLFRDRQM